MLPFAAKPYHWANTALYYTFLAVLVWAPLPLASNRDWSTRLLAGLLLGGLLWALVLLVTAVAGIGFGMLYSVAGGDAVGAAAVGGAAAA